MVKRYVSRANDDSTFHVLSISDTGYGYVFADQFDNQEDADLTASLLNRDSLSKELDDIKLTLNRRGLKGNTAALGLLRVCAWNTGGDTGRRIRGRARGRTCAR